MKELIKVTVKGFVQGVGYRYFCYKKAKSCGIKGYVKNLFNGDVELEIEGDKGILNDYIKELKIGPVGSVVNSVYTERLISTEKYKDFNII
jgi:acylphosphatase